MFWALETYRDVATLEGLDFDMDEDADFLGTISDRAINREGVFKHEDLSVMFARAKEADNPLCSMVV